MGQDKIMNEDYERRIRNLEKALLAMGAILDQHLPMAANAPLNEVGEKFFYSISKNGINSDVEFEPPQ